jgi:hypothetical protein
MFHEQLLFGRLLDRARDPLAMPPSKDQCAQDQQIRSAL